MFSPYYAWSGRGDPLDHCAVNVALYSRAGHRWAMTERRRSSLRRTAAVLSIGPSSLAWEDGFLVVRFDEVSAPLPSRLRGTVRLHPSAVTRRVFALDTPGRHVWRPIAPHAAVEVVLDDPALSWRGSGYFDTNAGTEPLEHGFSAWDWSRAHLGRDTLLFYDVMRREGGAGHIALRIGADGEMRPIAPPPRTRLPPTLWRLPRAVRGDEEQAPELSRTLEDTPFYSRSLLRGRFGGEAADIVHEALSLDRLRSPVVRAMLPFRMPRRFW